MGSVASPLPVALVTGGEGDLARALAPALAEAGYEVRCPGRTELDVREEESVAAYFEELPRLDLLVNNAGVLRDRPHLRLGEEDWDEVVRTNLTGAFLCARAALRMMAVQRAGHLIHVSSRSAIRPPAGQANYAASKAGLIGLSQSIAREYGKRNIRSNCVLPGFLETRMTAGMAEEKVCRAREEHALGRFNTVEEAARFIAFLAGAEHVSGQVFQLDSRV